MSAPWSRAVSRGLPLAASCTRTGDRARPRCAHARPRCAHGPLTMRSRCAHDALTVRPRESTREHDARAVRPRSAHGRARKSTVRPRTAHERARCAHDAQRGRNVHGTWAARSVHDLVIVHDTCSPRARNVGATCDTLQGRGTYVSGTFRARIVHVPCTFRARSVHGPYTVRVLRMARSRKSFPRRKKSCGKSTFPKSHFPGAKESLGNGTFLKVIMLVFTIYNTEGFRVYRERTVVSRERTVSGP